MQLLTLAGEFNDQDGVLRGQGDQDDKADLCKHIVVHAHQVHPGHCRQQTHRHDQDDRQRHDQALVLCGQHQEDEQDRQSEDIGRRIAGGGLLICNARPLGRIALRNRRRRDLFHGHQRMTGRSARRRIAIDGHGRGEVVARYAVRPGGVGKRRERAERNHRSIGRAGMEPGNVAHIVAIVRLRLCGHSVRAAQQVEIVDEGAAEIDRKRIENVCRGHAQHLGLVAVDIGLHAGRARVEEGIDTGQTFLTIRLGDDLIGDLLHVAIVLAGIRFQHHAKAPRRTDPLDHGRFDDHQACFVDVRSGGLRGSDKFVDRFAATLAVLEFVEHPIGGRRTCGLRLRRAVEARQHDGALDAFDRQDALGHLLHHGICSRGRRPGRELDDGHEIALILLRNEAGWRRAER